MNGAEFLALLSARRAGPSLLDEFQVAFARLKDVGAHGHPDAAPRSSAQERVHVLPVIEMNKILFPEKFTDVDLKKKADEIFTAMVGKPYMT